MNFTRQLAAVTRRTIRTTNSDTTVYIFPWLNAKDKHVERYTQKLYGNILNKNHDLNKTTLFL
jgi:hypothetical protein